MIIIRRPQQGHGRDNMRGWSASAVASGISGCLQLGNFSPGAGTVGAFSSVYCAVTLLSRGHAAPRLG